MKRSTLAASGLTLGALILVLILFFTAPVGRFLQSNIFQSTYVSRDPGLYVGIEQTTATGKLLKADQGLRLRSAPAKVGTTNVVDVYFQVINSSDSLNGNSFKVVVTYDKSQLSMKDMTGIVPLTGLTIDQDFTKILRAADGTETGTLYIGVDKSTDFVKPIDEVLRLRFEAKTSTVRSAHATLSTLRLYKRENLAESTAATLYLTKNEGERTVSEPLNILFDGTVSEVTESQITGGGILRREVQKDSVGNIIRTIETTYDTASRIVRISTTYPNGDSELALYEYRADGGYTVTLTKRVNGQVTIMTINYDKTGVMIPGGQTSTNSNGNVNNNSNNNANRNTNGVSTAATNANTNGNANINASTATTTATTCNPSANERFNDIVGHWSAVVVEQARQKCIISGKALGRFAPDEPVTRAELTKIAVEAFKVSQSQSGTLGLVDVSDSEWYANYVRAAKLAGIVSGYSDGTFKPNNEVNRAEALKIILEAGVKTRGQQLGLNVEGRFSSWMNQNPTFTYVRFPDVKIADWFGKYVLSGFERGVVRGYNDRGTDVFRPAQPVTRAEAVKMIMSIVQ